MLFEGTERKQLERRMKAQGRLPPEQSLTLKWPVLHYGSVPRFDPQTWDFRIYGLVETPLNLSWDEFNALPKVQRTSDFRCVPLGWSVSAIVAAPEQNGYHMYGDPWKEQRFSR